MDILLLIIIVMGLIMINKKDGYQNNVGYMKNMSTNEYPDDTVFYACNEKVELEECDGLDEDNCELNRNCIFNEGICQAKRFPNTHYRVINNSIKEPLDGTFSAFLDVYGLRNYNHFYHAPICEDTYNFVSDFENQDRQIIQEQDEITGLLEEEKLLDEKMPKDYKFNYESAEYNGNRILYTGKLQNKFLEVKDGMRRKDDFSHLEGYNSAYDTI